MEMSNHQVSENVKNKNKESEKVKKPLCDLPVNLQATGAIKKRLNITKSSINKSHKKEEKLTNLYKKEIDDILSQPNDLNTDKTYNGPKFYIGNESKNLSLILSEWEIKHGLRQEKENIKIQNFLPAEKDSKKKVKLKSRRLSLGSNDLLEKEINTTKNIGKTTKIINLRAPEPIHTDAVTKKRHSSLRYLNFTITNDLINKQFQEPLREPKLRKRDSKQNSSSTPICEEIFNEELLNDIIQSGLDQEKKILLPQNFLSTFNHDSNNRRSIIDWMIYVQEWLEYSDGELYLAVSLLDQVLAKKSVEKENYELVGLTCVLLSNKFIGLDNLSLHTLLRWTNTAYTIEQLLEMEVNILKLLNYQINSIEPTTFVNSYLQKLDMVQDFQNSSSKVYFVLDFALNLPEYSSTCVSIVSAAAIILAIFLFENERLQMVNEYFKHRFSLDEAKQCKKIQQAILGDMKLRESKSKYIVINKYKNCKWLKIEKK